MPGYAFFNISYHDYGGEVSGFRCRTPELSGAAVDYDAMLVEFVDLQDKIAGITIGLKVKAERVQGNTVALGNAPVVEAQRETKWLVQYHDDTTKKKFTLEIPCADLTMLDPGDRPHANIGDAGAVDDFVAAFEAYAITPDGGVPVVDEITHVERNT